MNPHIISTNKIVFIFHVSSKSNNFVWWLFDYSNSLYLILYSWECEREKRTLINTYLIWLMSPKKNRRKIDKLWIGEGFFSSVDSKRMCYKWICFFYVCFSSPVASTVCCLTYGIWKFVFVVCLKATECDILMTLDAKIPFICDTLNIS